MVDVTETGAAAGTRRRFMAPRVFPASEVLKSDVRNAAGEDLGEVHEIMLDVATGRIAYAVLAYGGVLGVGEKFFAIPWDMFAQVPGEDYWILNLTREELDRAPGFDRDHWPMTEEVEWYLEEGRPPERAREEPMEPFRSRHIIGLEEPERYPEERRAPEGRVTTRYIPVQKTEYVPVQTVETEAERARRERR